MIVVYDPESFIIILMKSRGQNLRINQVITLSQNYKIHRHNIDNIKPSINSHSKRR